jgi:hypothetical protein
MEPPLNLSTAGGTTCPHGARHEIGGRIAANKLRSYRSSRDHE